MGLWSWIMQKIHSRAEQMSYSYVNLTINNIKNRTLMRYIKKMSNCTAVINIRYENHINALNDEID